MRRRTVYQFLSWAAVAVWITIIFVLSSQDGETSSRLSATLAAWAVGLAEKLAGRPVLTVEDFHGALRNFAHFFTYCMLGILMLNAYLSIGTRQARALVWTLVLSVAIAGLDELNQLLRIGRGSELRDVATDSAGAATGIALLVLARWLLQRRRRSR